MSGSKRTKEKKKRRFTYIVGALGISIGIIMIIYFLQPGGCG